MQNLTLNQKRVLDFIKKYQEKQGTPPTYEALAKGLGYRAKSTMHHYVEALIAKGYLTKEHHLSHGLTLHTEGNALPILGKVAAGMPIEYKKFDERLEVPAFFLRKPGNYFVLQVSGDSMIGEGILDGDYVVVREQAAASSGEIVVAELEDGATIKRFFKKKNHIELHSANEKYKPILVQAHQNFRISGIYSGLLRR